MKRRTILALLVLLIGVFAFAAVGCGGDDDDDDGAPAATDGGEDGEAAPDLPPVTALPSASCTDIEFEGDGEPQVLIASDLPLQGSSRTQTLQMTGAIRQVLASAGWKAGAVNVGYQSCDDSTAADVTHPRRVTAQPVSRHPISRQSFPASCQPKAIADSRPGPRP